MLYVGCSPAPDWNDPETLETLRLCLSCKACKSECPSNVDVARLKAEYTAHTYRQRGGAPLAARLFGHIRKINALASLTPNLANWIANLAPVRALSNRLLNLHPKRSLPAFAKSLYNVAPPSSLRRSVASSLPTVILFADCFTTYNEPHIGQAAIRLLQAFGYNVQLPKVGCCGRSMISNGLLDDTIASADEVLAVLAPLAAREDVAAIVVCEPSCLSAMTDDWLQLKLKTPKAARKQIAAKAISVEDFLETHWDQHPRRPALKPAAAPIYFHGHCHQKALWGEGATAKLLRRLASDEANSALSTQHSALTLIPSGCCGMAGAFGYTADRYDLSMKIADQSLGEHLRNAPPGSLVLAPGTSCRHQIHDLTGQKALHPIELLAQAILDTEKPS